MGAPLDEDRADRVRRAREVLSGAAVSPPLDAPGYRERFLAGGIEFRYFLGLSVLVLLAAVLYFVWGLGAASPVLLILALGLLAGWLIL